MFEGYIRGTDMRILAILGLLCRTDMDDGITSPRDKNDFCLFIPSQAFLLFLIRDCNMPFAVRLVVDLHPRNGRSTSFCRGNPGSTRDDAPERVGKALIGRLNSVLTSRP